MTGDCCFLKFLRRSVDGKYLMRFQSETSVFKLQRRSVGAGSDKQVWLKISITRQIIFGKKPHDHGLARKDTVNSKPTVLIVVFFFFQKEKKLEKKSKIIFMWKLILLETKIKPIIRNSAWSYTWENIRPAIE